jgi:ribosomal protein S18 acetylase RimI-like enzyme
MSELLIRKAVPSDARRLVELRLFLQQHCEESNPSIWRITREGRALLKQKVEGNLLERNSQVLVAEVYGEVVGFAHGEVTHRTDYLPKSVGSISTLYVIKRFRRRGIGTRLVKELCKVLRLEGAEQVTLRYIIGNKEAEGFWNNLGFKPIITTVDAHPKEVESRAERQAT